MPRSNPPPAKLLQELIRLGLERLSPRWMLILGVGLAACLLLLPVLRHSLGWWDLHGLSDVASDSTGDSSPAPSGPVPRATESFRSAPDRLNSDQSATTAVHRILHQDSREVFVSPAGLRYTPGSQQGHRLKHLMRHARDELNRPGQHGVFDHSDPIEVVALVDRAYRQALAGAPTDTRHEDQRTVYTVDLHRRIGYVGGQAGSRQNYPPCSQLRLVIDGHNLITAFPVRP